MKKSIIFCFLLLILITSVTNAYAETYEDRLKWNEEAMSTYTDYPAVLEYFLQEDHSGGGWKSSKVMALVEGIIKNCDTDYEKARAIFNWVCTNLPPYDSNKENNVYDSLLEARLDAGVNTSSGHTYVLISFLRAAGIPAAEQIIKNPNYYHYATAYVDGRWIIIDPTRGTLNADLQMSLNGIHEPSGYYFDIPLDRLSQLNMYLTRFNLPYSRSMIKDFTNSPVINIPEGYTEISISEFEYDLSITQVNFPTTIKEIDYFREATNLKQVMIPKDSELEKINDSAFYLCTSLEEVILPDNLKRIGYFAFAGCNSLKKIVIPPSVTLIEDNAFSTVEYNTMDYDLNLNRFTSMTHRFELTDLVIYGEINTYAHKYAIEHNIKFQPLVAYPTNSRVLINSFPVSFEAYLIEGNNYFKLRDLAKALENSTKNFEVIWDNSKNAINLLSNKNYTSVGGELIKGESSNMTYNKSNAKTYIDGELVDLKAFTIGGNNYFKLRDIAKAFNIGVTYNAATNEIGIDTSIGYK